MDILACPSLALSAKVADIFIVGIKFHLSATLICSNGCHLRGYEGNLGSFAQEVVVCKVVSEISPTGCVYGLPSAGSPCSR